VRGARVHYANLNKIRIHNRTIIIFLNVYNTPLRHVTHTHFLAHSSSDSASDELYLKLLDA